MLNANYCYVYLHVYPEPVLVREVFFAHGALDVYGGRAVFLVLLSPLLRNGLLLGIFAEGVKLQMLFNLNRSGERVDTHRASGKESVEFK